MPRYSKEFKEQAVERLRSTGESVHRMCSERMWESSWAALTRWCRQFARRKGRSAVDNTEEELQAARKTIRRLEMASVRNLKKSGGLLRQGKRMRYEFVKAEKAIYPVSVLCHVLRVSRSGFYRLGSARGVEAVAGESVPVEGDSSRSPCQSKQLWQPPDHPRATGRGDFGW